MKKNNKKIIHLVTTSQSINLMSGQLNFLKQKGYNPIAVSSFGPELSNLEDKNIRTKQINMTREITPLKDLIALIKIIVYLIKERPALCNASTPKAGLLGIMAAWITRVPNRVYTLRGLPLESASGFKKFVLLITEKIACSLSTKIIVISPSLKKKIINLNLAKEDKVILFGKGSSNGIKLEKYNYTKEIENIISKIKNELNITNRDFLIGYVGRINKDKGIIDLLKAFDLLNKKYKNLKLLIIGNFEKNNLDDHYINLIKEKKDIYWLGYKKDVVPFYYLMDVLAFPTHREGFGNVSIEAQATGTPVITTNATGARDTVINKKTGFIVKKKDYIDLANKIGLFINKPELKKELGSNGNKWVIENFSSKLIWNSLNEFYSKLIS